MLQVNFLMIYMIHRILLSIFAGAFWLFNVFAVLKKTLIEHRGIKISMMYVNIKPLVK